jgi:hypothetical protein
MFEKFGEFDSAEELNRAAAAQKAENDKEALIILAKENGIDEGEVEDYLDGFLMLDELVTPLMAATGKLKVETEDLKLTGVLADWVNELEMECTESEEVARAVRKKGKELAGYIALLADTGFKNKAVVDKRIVEKCSGELKQIVGPHEFYIGIPDKAERKRLMRQYYIGE